MAVLATDNYNRSENPLSTNWGISHSGAFLADGSSAAPTNAAADCGDRNTAVSWPNDQYSQGKITTTGTIGNGRGPGVMTRASSSSPTKNFYWVTGDHHAGSANWALQKMVSNSLTNLGSREQAWSDGDVLYLSSIGSQHVTSIGGVQLFEPVSDAAIASGNPGIGYSATATSSTIDDWKGGDLTSTMSTLPQNDW